MKRHCRWFCIIFLLINMTPCLAGVPDSSEDSYRKALVNRYLTPARVLQMEKRIFVNGGTDRALVARMNSLSLQTALWVGRVEIFTRAGNETWLNMRSADGVRFLARAGKNVRNLDVDRTDCLLALKGSPVIENNRLSGFSVRSAIVLAPSGEMNERFVERFPHFSRKTADSFCHRFILHRIFFHNPHYDNERIDEIAGAIMKYSRKYGIDPLLLTALINVESAFDVTAVSRTGAIGLGQLMPATARSMGVNPHIPDQNVAGSAIYLSRQLSYWKGYRDRIDRALASYNAGPGAVSSHGGIPPFSETRNYVFFINFLYEMYRKQYDRVITGM